MSSEQSITVTDLAAQKIKEVLSDEGKDPNNTALRVSVQGGGCSGFQYGLAIDTDQEGHGSIYFESNGVKLVTDPISIRYLQGTEIDYKENASGGGFTIKNPNATSTCGCGQSFNTDDEK